MSRKNEQNDQLGCRMKIYESQTTGTKLMPNLPVYCRIDGRAFHTFCRRMTKPYDLDFITVMQNVCKDLVKIQMLFWDMFNRMRLVLDGKILNGDW